MRLKISKMAPVFLMCLIVSLMVGATGTLADNLSTTNLSFSSPSGSSIAYQSGGAFELDMDITGAVNLELMDTAFSLAWDPSVVRLVNNPTDKVELQNCDSSQLGAAWSGMIGYGSLASMGYGQLFFNIDQSATAAQLDVSLGKLRPWNIFGSQTSPADIKLMRFYFEMVGPGNPNIHLVENPANAGAGNLIYVGDYNSPPPYGMDFGKTSNTALDSSPTLSVTSSVSVTGVALDKHTDLIPVNGTDQLTATVSPANATDKSVTWSSDKPSVATVDPNTGLVTAVALGTANITVTTTDGGFKDTCALNVYVPINPGAESFPILSAPPSYFERY